MAAREPEAVKAFQEILVYSLKRASLNNTGQHDSAQNRVDVTCIPKNPVSMVEGD